MIKYSNISIFKEKPEEKLKEALPPPNEDVLNGTHDNGYRKKYTGREFDKLCCLFDRLNLEPEYIPSTNTMLTRILPDPEPYITFLIWLDWASPSPRNAEEKSVLSFIRKYLSRTVSVE